MKPKVFVFVITFVGNVTLVVVTSFVRSVDSVVIDSELEIGTVIGTDSTLFVIEMGELAACATVIDKVGVDCDSVVSAFDFGVVDLEVEVDGVSCDVVDVDVDMDDDDGGDGVCDDDDDDDGCVTSIDGY